MGVQVPLSAPELRRRVNTAVQHSEQQLLELGDNVKARGRKRQERYIDHGVSRQEGSRQRLVQRDRRSPLRRRLRSSSASPSCVSRHLLHYVTDNAETGKRAADDRR